MKSFLTESTQQTGSGDLFDLTDRLVTFKLMEDLVSEKMTCSINNNGITNNLAETVLQPRVTVDPSPITPPLPGTKETKPVFDLLYIAVRKKCSAT